MRRQTLLAVLAATMLVLAGCAGSTGGDESPTSTDTPTPGTEDTDGNDTDGTDSGGTATGTVQFYVSDDPGQIDDFRHLNVTITQIGFERAGGSGDDTDDAENETDDDTVENETDDDTDSDGTPTNESTPNDGADGADSQQDDEDEKQEEGEGDGWVTRDVDSRTVDLTRLKGDNATLIDSPEIAAGNYTKVFVHVSEINATLTDGTSANVKLPSEKLQLTKGFALEPNGTMSFVYDISVFKAGNSGKYILKPVISESGPDRTVESVDEDRGRN